MKKQTNLFMTFLLLSIANVMNAAEYEIDQRFTSVAALDGQLVAIVNETDQKAIYNINAQNLDYADYTTAMAGTGYLWKFHSLANESDPEVQGGYTVEIVTATGGSISLWGITSIYLNSGAEDGFDGCFVLGNGSQYGTDVKYGGVWFVEYDADKGFALKNKARGGYFAGVNPAPTGTDPIYWTFCTLKENVPTNSLTEFKEELISTIDMGKMVNGLAYTDETFGALLTAIGNGEAALTNESPTVQSLSTAAKAITDCMNDLMLKDGFTNLTADVFKQWDRVTNPTQGSAINCSYELFVSSSVPYGDANVNYLNFANLSEYDKLFATYSDGSPRLLMNRDVDLGQWDSDENQSHMIDNTMEGWSSKYFTKEEGVVTVDLTQLVADKGFANLNSIKSANWGGDMILTGLYLFKSSESDSIRNDYFISEEFLLTPDNELGNFYNVNILSGGTLTTHENITNSLPMNNINLEANLYSDLYAQIMSATDMISITGDLSERIYTQGMTWNFISLPFDCDLSRLATDNGTAYAIRYYDGASRAAKNLAQDNWRNYGKNDIIPMGTGFIYMTQNDTWTQFYAVNNESKNHVFQSTSGTTILSMERNEAAESAHSGWNLLGNPYANYYSIHAMNFDKAVTYWNGNTYEVCFPYDDDLALKPNQAFFVQCPENTFGITMPGSGRQLTSEISSGAKARRIAMNKGKDRKLVNFSLSDSEFTDKTRVVLNEEASMGYELEHDAGKFMSMRTEVPQLYSLGTDGTKYAINERPMDDGTVRLGLYIPQDGDYTLTITRNDAEQILLTDSETGKTIDLTEGSYSFHARKGTYNNRLMFTFGTVTGMDDVRWTMYDEQWSMYDERCTMYDGPCGEAYYDLSGRRIGKPTKAGVYLMKKGKTVQKVWVK